MYVGMDIFCFLVACHIIACSFLCQLVSSSGLTPTCAHVCTYVCVCV